MQVLFCALFVLGGAVLLYPFYPSIDYALNPPDAEFYPYETRLATLPKPDEKPTPEQQAPKPRPAENRLVIPKIGVDIPVVEGKNERALLVGAWRIPGTSTTPEKSNMVVSAHRFRYRPPSSKTFYLLDKLKAGDIIILYWKGQEYDYRVSETAVVGPKAVEILDPTASPRLTLFTCTPLFSTAKRLVVVATPV